MILGNFPGLECRMSNPVQSLLGRTLGTLLSKNRLKPFLRLFKHLWGKNMKKKFFFLEILSKKVFSLKFAQNCERNLGKSIKTQQKGPDQALKALTLYWKPREGCKL